MIERIRFLVTTCMITLLASPVLAQQAPAPGGPPPGFRYGPMWRGGGHGVAMILGPFVLLLALIGFVTVIAVLVRIFSYRAHYRWRGYGDGARGMARPGRAADILEERFARGEIDTAEFEIKRKLLSR